MGRHRVGDVLRQRRDPLHLGALTELHFIAGHRRATGEINDFSVDIKLFKNTGDRGHDGVICGTARLGWGAGHQNARIGQPVGRCRGRRRGDPGRRRGR